MRSIESPRIAAVDVVKAAAIVTVVWIHCFQRIGATSETAARLGLLARFAVPAFFFAAGFLQALAPGGEGARGLRRRLMRITAPYVVASLVALSYHWIALGWRPNPTWVALHLLTGSAFGIYYFVPMLFGATLLGALLHRMPRLAKPLAVALVLVGYLYEARLVPAPPPFWDFRNPLRWWGYFAAGFVFGTHWPRLRLLAPRTTMALGAGLLATSGVMLSFCWTASQGIWTRSEGSLQYALIYTTTLGLFFAGMPLSSPPRARRLADASYTIYLYHLFFVDLGMAVPWLDYPLRNWLAWALGIAGPLGIVAAGTRLLGRRARALLG